MLNLFFLHFTRLLEQNACENKKKMRTHIKEHYELIVFGFVVNIYSCRCQNFDVRNIFTMLLYFRSISHITNIIKRRIELNE